jgi:fructose-1-phosphate kinase PfkB-like protein
MLKITTTFNRLSHIFSQRHLTTKPLNSSSFKLKSRDIEGVADYIKRVKSEGIVVLSGA